jgi:hypothetical protein
LTIIFGLLREVLEPKTKEEMMIKLEKAMNRFLISQMLLWNGYSLMKKISQAK